jgi:hypothetical protein
MKASVPVRFVMLEQNGLHLFVKTKINGKVCNMLIDTGASNTVMDEKFFKKKFANVRAETSENLSTGLGTRSMKMRTALFRKIAIGKVEVNKYHIALLDLSHVNHAYEAMGHPAVEAVLGSDLLLCLRARIDFEKQILLVRKPRL